MEIAPTARRRVWTARAATFLVVVIVAPVTVLALVPTAFGFERYVAANDAMSASVGRGTLMFDRMVPASDLSEGDIVSYRPPTSSGIEEVITRRVVEVGDGFVQTQADTLDQPDPWSLDQREYPAISRMVVGVPFVGYPFLVAEGRSTWNILLVAAGGLLMVVIARDFARTRRSQDDPPIPLEV